MSTYLTDPVEEKILSSENIKDAANNAIEMVRNECVHITESIYIDCDPDQQAIVDMVQGLIAEQIMEKLS